MRHALAIVALTAVGLVALVAGVWTGVTAEDEGHITEQRAESEVRKAARPCKQDEGVECDLYEGRWSCYYGSEDYPVTFPDPADGAPELSGIFC